MPKFCPQCQSVLEASTCLVYTSNIHHCYLISTVSARSRFLELLCRIAYQSVDMSTTLPHLVHKAFRPCEYYGHMAWQPCSIIHVIFNAVVVAKLTYAASSWWGFTTAEDRQRLEAVIRRGIHSGLCAPDHMSVEDLFTDADCKLFNHILYSKYHLLHAILPGRSDFNYNLRPKRHNLVPTAKSLSVTDRDFITRMIYKDIYWSRYTFTFT